MSSRKDPESPCTKIRSEASFVSRSTWGVIKRRAHQLEGAFDHLHKIEFRHRLRGLVP